MTRLHLPPPKNKRDVAAALKAHYEAGEHEHKHQWVGWTWAWRFMQGLRSEGPRGKGSPTGVPTPTYRDSRGRRRVRFEKILPQVQTEVSRILNIDLAPAIERRRGTGLDHLRGESMCQAACDEFYHKRVKSIEATLALMIAIYGPVGLAVVPGQTPGMSWFPGLAIAPPWELRPLPAGPIGRHDVAGISWRRWVPWSWFKRSHGQGLKIPSLSESALREKLQLRAAQKASVLQADHAPPGLGGAFPMTGSSQTLSQEYDPEYRADGSRDDTEYYVLLGESFIKGDNETMSRYIVTLGDDWVSGDRDFTDAEWQERLGQGVMPPMPIHVPGYQEAPSFYHRSFLSRLLPINREFEFILGSWIDSQKKMESLRKVWLPHGSGMNVRNFKAARNEPVCGWMPDHLVHQAQPMITEPPNVGEDYGPTLNALGAMLNELSQQGPLFQGKMPGRTSSALGAATVGEFQDVPLVSCAQLLEDAMRGVYRAALFHMRTYLSKELNPMAPQKALVRLARLDESVLGLKFNSESGEFDLSEHSIPDPSDVRISIRDKNPRPPAMVYQELKEGLSTGRLTQAGFEILIVKEGLDVPIENRTAYNNYEAAWAENVILFGDGQTPGKFTTHPGWDNHSIHMLVHWELVQSLAFRAASEAVQDEFLKHIQRYHRPQVRNWVDAANSMAEYGMAGPVAPGAAAAVGRQQQTMRLPNE